MLGMTIFMGVGTDVWITVAFVLSILAAFGGYFFFVKPNRKFPNKFVTWLKEFLNFSKLIIEPTLKITYIFLTLYVILISFNLISYSFLSFLEYLIISVVSIRIVYEACLILIGIGKDTKEINSKMK